MKSLRVNADRVQDDRFLLSCWFRQIGELPRGDLSTVFGFKYVDGTMVYKLTKITSLDGVEGFKKHVSELGLDLRIDDRIDPPSECSLYRPISWNGRQIGNRVGAALCPLSFPLYELQAPMVKILLMLS